MRKIIAILSLIVMLFIMTGCDFLKQSNEELSTPIITNVDNNENEVIVYWTSVHNAVTYVISIDGREIEVIQNYYNICDTVKKDCTVEIKVKARGILTESEWSEPYTIDVEYNGEEDNTNNNNNNNNNDNENDTNNNQNNNNDNLTKLNTPKNVLYNEETHRITWDYVENADKYEVVINSKKYETYDLTFEVEFSTEQEFVYKVRAIGDGIEYSSSDYTKPTSAKYIIELDNYEYYDDYLKYQLGFGINIITAEYLNASQITSSTFLDIKKLSNMYELRSFDQVKDSKFETASGETYDSFASEVATKYTFGSSASFGIDAGGYGFSSTLAQKFTNNSNIKITSKTKQYYNFGFQYMIDKRSSIINFDPNQISEQNVLTSYAINKLNEILSEKDEDRQEKLILEFYDIFGTHIIKDALYGGKVEVFFYLISNDETFDYSLTNDYNRSLKGEGGYGPYEGSVETSIGISNALSTSIETGKTVSQFSARFIGGGPVGMEGSQNMEEFYKSYSVWLEEYKKTSDKNTMISLVEGGLCPIWDLLPSEYKSLEDVMQKTFNKRLKFVNEEVKNKILGYCEFSGGIGTKEDPYLIENEEQFALINEYLGIDNIWFKLVNDITINGNTWQPIGKNVARSEQYNENYQDLITPEAQANSFRGYLLGNNKTIKYTLKMDLFTTENGQDYSFGLFGLLNGANIIDLKVEGEIEGTIKTRGDANVAGLIAGWAIYTNFENCITAGKVIQDECGGDNLGQVSSGGLVGYAEGCKFENCVNNAYVHTKVYWGAISGGIIGRARGEIDINRENCVNNGELYARKTIPWYNPGVAFGSFESTGDLIGLDETK